MSSSEINETTSSVSSINRASSDAETLLATETTPLIAGVKTAEQTIATTIATTTVVTAFTIFSCFGCFGLCKPSVAEIAKEIVEEEQEIPRELPREIVPIIEVPPVQEPEVSEPPTKIQEEVPVVSESPTDNSVETNEPAVAPVKSVEPEEMESPVDTVVRPPVEQLKSDKKLRRLSSAVKDFTGKMRTLNRLRSSSTST
ncbi:hypothetical protein HK098_001688 [Nowakowskiella sp. JEL0407]|nr:hypothetical protein HK098_001688 [Nowakowskiella sp. JEL0407]